MSNIIDYDPNLFFCGRTATQKVKLTFGLWKFRAERIVEVGGNCRGFDILDSALENAYEQLPKSGRYETPFLLLTDAEGNECQSEDEENRDVYWLGNMLIATEIIGVEPDAPAAAA